MHGVNPALEMSDLALADQADVAAEDAAAACDAIGGSHYPRQRVLT